MGIIVLAVAVLPRLRVGGRQLLESELAGPQELERLGTSIRETARRLWVLYVGLTRGGHPRARSARLERGRPRDEPVRGGRARLLGDSRSAASPPRPPRWPAFAPGDAVDAPRLHRARRDQLPASLPPARAAACRRRGADEELRLYLTFLVLGSALILVEVLGGRDRRQARRRSATRCSRPSRS